MSEKLDELRAVSGTVLLVSGLFGVFFPVMMVYHSEIALSQPLKALLFIGVSGVLAGGFALAFPAIGRALMRGFFVFLGSVMAIALVAYYANQPYTEETPFGYALAVLLVLSSWTFRKRFLEPRDEKTESLL